jgi:hypothetical protein
MVESQMSYLEPWAHKSEAPYVRGRVEEGFPRTNFVNQTYPVRIRNARPQQDLFHLDTHGFAFYEAGELNNEIVDAIRTRRKCLVEEKYYPEVCDLVKHKTGASKVIVFDHTYRRRDPALAPNENPNGREQPATLVSY